MDIYEVATKMKIERKTIFDLPLRVTYYARVSTTKEEQDSSIDNQIQYFEELIKKNENWTYIQGYHDRIRGENAQNREQFQQMINDGYAGKFDLILTKEVSRFARNTIDSLTYTRDLLRHGVGVFFQNDNICTIDTDSELRLTIMSSIAQDEVRKLSERIKFGHKKSIENGHVLGNSRIYGYDLKDCKLVINEKEAEMIKLIFELYATGEYSVRKIEDILYEKGYRNHNGNKLYHTTISNLIQNPKYKGYYCGNKVKIIDYRTKEQKFLPENEWVMYKDETGQVVPKIVDEDIWDKANNIFKERSNKVKEAGRSAKGTSPLSGKVICGVHQSIFWRTSYSERIHKGKPIYQWICREKKKQRNARACKTFAIYESELYKILADVIINLCDNQDEDIDTIIRIYKESISDNNIGNRIDACQKSIIRLEDKKHKLLDLYTDDMISKLEFKERNEIINDEIVKLKEEIEVLQEEKNDNKNVISTIQNIRNILDVDIKQLRDGEKINTRLIENICKDLIEAIEVYPVDDNNMRLNIRLKIGLSENYQYTKTNSRSLGHIFKKMIESYENNAK